MVMVSWSNTIDQWMKLQQIMWLKIMDGLYNERENVKIALLSNKTHCNDWYSCIYEDYVLFFQIFIFPNTYFIKHLFSRTFIFFSYNLTASQTSTLYSFIQGAFKAYIPKFNYFPNPPILLWNCINLLQSHFLPPFLNGSLEKLA